jgi:hypothetical protein
MEGGSGWRVTPLQRWLLQSPAAQIGKITPLLGSIFT